MEDRDSCFSPSWTAAGWGGAKKKSKKYPHSTSRGLGGGATTSVNTLVHSVPFFAFLKIRFFVRLRRAFLFVDKNSPLTALLYAFWDKQI